jgi:hypothetical protein
MPYEVFVSYSSTDLETATALRTWIQHAGAQAFIAEYSVLPSQALAATIENAIRRCDLFVLLWSGNAAKSAWVPQEIGMARGLSKPILPIVLHEGAAPPAFIGDLKYLPLYPDPNAAVQQFYAQLQGRVAQKQFGDSVTAIVSVGLVLAAMASLGDAGGGGGGGGGSA